MLKKPKGCPIPKIRKTITMYTEGGRNINEHGATDSYELDIKISLKFDAENMDDLDKYLLSNKISEKELIKLIKSRIK